MFGVWILVFFFKQKTAYEMRISDWSSDVCSSDLRDVVDVDGDGHAVAGEPPDGAAKRRLREHDRRDDGRLDEAEGKAEGTVWRSLVDGAVAGHFPRIGMRKPDHLERTMDFGACDLVEEAAQEIGRAHV